MTVYHLSTQVGVLFATRFVACEYSPLTSFPPMQTFRKTSAVVESEERQLYSQIIRFTYCNLLYSFCTVHTLESMSCIVLRV